MNAARNHTNFFGGSEPGRACEVHRGTETSAPLPLDANGIDWLALRSRLFAAYGEPETREDAAASILRLRGSFAGAAVPALDSYQTCLRSVNLDVSSNGKPPNGTDTPAAGVNGSGERG
jgi:hypothetical protein